MYNEGISKSGDIIDLAVTHEIIEKAGAWFAYAGAKIGQGREAAKQYLSDNPKIMDEIAKKIREAAAKES
ncbi:MAG: recombinase RecA, partial [Candidatus Saccharimonadales bacterium]